MTTIRVLMSRLGPPFSVVPPFLLLPTRVANPVAHFVDFGYLLPMRRVSTLPREDLQNGAREQPYAAERANARP